jgi:hypothetical protein
MHLLTLHSSLFDGRIGGAGGQSWWSPIQVLASILCVCGVMCAVYSVPLCQVFVIAARLGNWLLLLHLVIAADITGRGNFL